MAQQLRGSKVFAELESVCQRTTDAARRSDHDRQISLHYNAAAGAAALPVNSGPLTSATE